MSPSRSLRRVVADDSGVNRLVVRRRLEGLGCFVTEAADGREALAALPGSASDVVLLDLEMPVMGGLEVARRIRKSETGSDQAPADRRLRIIAVTGTAGREDRARCQAAGIDAVLEKPVGLDDLERAVAP